MSNAELMKARQYTPAGARCSAQHFTAPRRAVLNNCRELPWLQSDVQLRDMPARSAYVPACEHGMDYYNYKSWACCATFSSIAKPCGACKHPPASYQVIAGAKLNGQYISSSNRTGRVRGTFHFRVGLSQRANFTVCQSPS